MKNKIDWKRPECVATLSAFFAGIAVHMFGLVNVLHNYDDISTQPRGFGTGLTSGRWFLEILGSTANDIFGGYNLHWVNGVLFVALLAIAVGVLISIFEVKNNKIAVAIGMVFVSFPSVTATMLFRFTTVYYGIAILLAVFAAWFLVKCKFGIIPSILCSALALGIYQAYMPLTISVLVLYLIKQILQENIKFGEVIYKGLYFCCAIILGLLLYMQILQTCLEQNNAVLSGYKGVDQMGQLNLKEIPGLIWSAVKSVCLLPINDYCSLAQTALLQNAYLLLGITTILIILFAAFNKKLKVDKIVLLTLLCVVFPLAVNFVRIMCPDYSIYTHMVYAFAMIPSMPLILMETLPSFEGWRGKLQCVLKSVAAVLASVIIVCNSYMANVNYTSAYYANCQTENYFNSLVAQIRMTEGFDTQKKWAYIGKINDPLLNNSWQNVPIYDGNAFSRSLVSTYSWRSWIFYHCGYTCTWANTTDTAELQENEVVQNMPCWPNEGSIKVIDDYVVIKFSEN